MCRTAVSDMRHVIKHVGKIEKEKNRNWERERKNRFKLPCQRERERGGEIPYVGF